MIMAVIAAHYSIIRPCGAKLAQLTKKTKLIHVYVSKFSEENGKYRQLKLE